MPRVKTEQTKEAAAAQTKTRCGNSRGDADDANRPPDQPVEGVPVVPGERPAAPKPKAKKGPVQELLNLLGARSMRSTKASMVDSVVDAYLAKRMAAQASVSGASD